MAVRPGCGEETGDKLRQDLFPFPEPSHFYVLSQNDEEMVEGEGIKHGNAVSEQLSHSATATGAK